MERLTFRGLTIGSDSEVDLLFEGDDGTAVTWRFTRTEGGGVGVISGPEEFYSLYRQVPGPPFPDWPERLAGQALAARREPFPAKAAALRAIEEARAEARRCWEEGSTE